LKFDSGETEIQMRNYGIKEMRLFVTNNKVVLECPQCHWIFEVKSPGYFAFNCLCEQASREYHRRKGNRSCTYLPKPEMQKEIFCLRVVL
jgi:hypothetical protein